MSDSKNQLISIEIPYYTHWTWALLVLSFIIFILSCIVIRTTEKETKAELLISYIILSSCMFIGTIPFIIKTFTLKISDDNVGFYVLYPMILILSILNLTYSGMMLYKLEKEEEEEEEETKNYSGATLPVVCFLLLVFYAVSSTFEYKKNKEAMNLVYQGGKSIYNKGDSLGKAAADKYERYRLNNILRKEIKNKQGNSELSREELDQLVRDKMTQYNRIKEDIISSSPEKPYPPNELHRKVLQKLQQQQKEKQQIKSSLMSSLSPDNLGNLSPEDIKDEVNRQYRRRVKERHQQGEKLKSKYFLHPQGGNGSGDAAILAAIEREKNKN